MFVRSSTSGVLCGVLVFASLAGCSNSRPPGRAPGEPMPGEQMPQNSPTLGGEEAPESPAGAEAEGDEQHVVVVDLQPAPGQDVTGQVTFTDTGDGVRVEGVVEGLTPGKHGFHLHEKGDCSAPDFESAGPHFNPTGADHAAPDDPTHHAGDLGNVVADADGTARPSILTHELSMEQGADNAIFGTALVVHADPDDLKSQPSGAAGARVACGVVPRTVESPVAIAR